MPRNERNNSITTSSHSAYYREMRNLALEKRQEYGVQTATFGLRELRKIYRAEGIRIDIWPLRSRRIRASYHCDDDDVSVLLKKGLPKEPTLFALTHELKHHYIDQAMIQAGFYTCGDYNANAKIEVAAEVFAAEFIYPEQEMKQLLEELEITQANCSAERIIAFKRACPAKVSYQFLLKRFVWFGLCGKAAFAKVQFQKLEESIYGLPIYKQPGFKKRRNRP